NIDDLHERAGSTNITHLHGVITFAQSSHNPSLIYPIDGDEIKMNQLCELGSQLRPHVVWFGEAVPMIEVAAELCEAADIFVLIGTSLAVYPAASLLDYVPKATPKFIVDPKIPTVGHYQNAELCPPSLIVRSALRLRSWIFYWKLERQRVRLSRTLPSYLTQVGQTVPNAAKIIPVLTEHTCLFDNNYYNIETLSIRTSIKGGRYLVINFGSCT
ncbi:unnamed protein product, partial [Rotaria sp. Silwood2]